MLRVVYLCHVIKHFRGEIYLKYYLRGINKKMVKQIDVFIIVICCCCVSFGTGIDSKIVVSIMLDEHVC